jgi:gas vesicle protein
MRSFVSFLLGLIIGAAAVLFLPNIRRENLNTEVKAQIQVLQKQIQELGGQLKDIKLPTPSSGPSPTPTPR